MGKGKEHKGIRWLIAAIILIGLTTGLSTPAFGYDPSMAKTLAPSANTGPEFLNITTMEDSSIMSGHPNDNYNSLNYVESGQVNYEHWGPGIWQALLLWDITPLIESNANINSATIKLCERNWFKSSTQNWYIRKMVNPFEEESITWNNYNQNNHTEIGQVIITPDSVLNCETYDVTSQLKDSLNGKLKFYGVNIHGPTAGYGVMMQYWSKEQTDQNLRPLLSVSYTPYKPSKPDFAISDVESVQVVWNADANGDGKTDLVAEKPTMVRVSIGMENSETLNKSQSIDVKLQFDGVDYSESRTIEELELANRTIDFYPALPIALGEQKIRAIIDPENKIGEDDESNNINSAEITVKETKGLHIAYFRIERTEDYGTVAEYNETVEKSGEFIQVTYPVSDKKFINEKRSEVIKGAKEYFLFWPSWLRSVRADCSEVAKTAKRLGADRGIGIVPENYFEFWGVSWARGQSFPSIKGGVVVLTGYWMPASHELGHTFGLKDQYTDEYEGKPASGFWVSKKQAMENKTSFMGSSDEYHSYNKTWIDEESYNELFKKFRDDPDPEILIVDGLIYKNGTIELGKWYRVEGQDDLSEIAPGNYSLELLNKDGNVLSQTDFRAEFYTNVNPGGVVETDFAAFTFAVPYPANGFAVKIVHENELITEVDLAGKLLADSMASLPEDYDTLLKLVKGSDIQKQTKKILLAKLKVAKKLAKSGISDIEKNRNFSAKIKLQLSSMVVLEFIKEVNNAKGSKIPESDAEQFITWAEKMILEPQEQIIDSLKPKLSIPPTPPPCRPTLPSMPFQIPCPQQSVMPATTDIVVNITDIDVNILIKNEMENMSKEYDRD